MSQFKRCQHGTCNARVVPPNTLCSHHRPREKRKHYTTSAESRRKRAEREKREKLLAGYWDGWSV